MENVWKRMKGPDKALSRLLALTLAVVMAATLFMVAWGSLDVGTDTILSFEASNPVVNLTVDIGTEQPYLPDTLRAVVELAEIEQTAPVAPPTEEQAPPTGNEEVPVTSPIEDQVSPTGDEEAPGEVEDSPVDTKEQAATSTEFFSAPEEPTFVLSEAALEEPVFVPETPLDSYDYEAADGGLYTYTDQTGAVSYRVYGSYSGSAPAWFACDEDGNVNGIIQEIPVTWSCTDYEKDTPGTYTFTASFTGYTYAGPCPFALITTEGEGIMPPSAPGAESTPTPTPAVQTNSISGKLWLDENEDGVMNETENGVAFYPIHLYATDDTGVAVQSTQTEEDGTYRFESLEPGSYVVGIAPETITEVDYLLPVVGISHDNQFEINEELSAAYSGPLMIAEDTAIENIHAGVRQIPVMEKMPFATTYTVTDFATLKKAVETDAVSGDTIKIENDITFTGAITINDKSLTFISTTPVVLTAKTSRHFRIEGETNNNITLTFDNVILDGGNTDVGTNGRGGIEYAQNALSLTLINPEIRNCFANNSSTAGGAIWVSERSELTITGGNLHENRSNHSSGGGAICGSESTITLTNCIIKNNKASNGGGIFGALATIHINGGAVTGNTSEFVGGGIYVTQNSALFVNGTDISGNTATGDGGGIYTSDSSYANPAATAKYSNISITGAAVISGNTAGQAFLPPSNASEFIARFPGTLLNNNDINYRNPYFVVTYKANNGTSQPDYLQQTTITGSGSVNTVAFATTGFTAPAADTIFLGWNTQEDGNGTAYTENAPMAITGYTTLYAKWLNAVVLTVSNMVTEPYANTTQAFTFTIRFFDAGGDPLPDGTELFYTGGIVQGSGATAPANGILTLAGGQATFMLKHGQQITIAGIPANNKVQVTQAAAEGYSTSFKDSKDTGSTTSLDTGVRDLSDGNRVFAFTNASIIVPAGILTGSTQGPVLLMLSALLIVGVGVGIHRKYRNRKENF
ncbi:DUF7601 domain-containing protein [Desulforamulus aeronauticus]|uniref:Polymorphic outer membrane protein repeat-containing protein n=1 Tax=Desulforamulus aeronauticus DSM 10349 TaxID=1121421 RepID=A0A1M6VT35_9FIRM|nr:SdrD B-like domain-containing protein [Desulforamulus aeronauticus]SHK84682.1 polymorphic outer membrane protein repeat-containing protein [Desulforamulus aeronauticus DSM 10349]